MAEGINFEAGLWNKSASMLIHALRCAPLVEIVNLHGAVTFRQLHVISIDLLTPRISIIRDCIREHVSDRITGPRFRENTEHTLFLCLRAMQISFIFL